jgi:hypothetical protein
LSESEPIAFRPRQAGHPLIRPAPAATRRDHSEVTAFNRQELSDILAIYGRNVAAGEWRDYAIDFTRDKAIFSVFRRAAEYPIYRIEKNPRLARKQGAYSVVAAAGTILKRGHDLRRVLGVLEPKPRLVD